MDIRKNGENDDQKFLGSRMSPFRLPSLPPLSPFVTKFGNLPSLSPPVTSFLNGPLKTSFLWKINLYTWLTAYFAHQQFSLTLIFTPSIFAQLLHFCAPLIFAQWYLIHFSFSIYLNVWYTREIIVGIRIAAIASFPGLSCVMDVDYGPYLVPLIFAQAKLNIFSLPLALRESKWCAKFKWVRYPLSVHLSDPQQVSRPSTVLLPTVFGQCITKGTAPIIKLFWSN